LFKLVFYTMLGLQSKQPKARFGNCFIFWWFDFDKLFGKLLLYKLFGDLW